MNTSNPQQDLLDKIDSLQKEIAEKAKQIEKLKAKNCASNRKDETTAIHDCTSNIQELHTYKHILNSVTEAIYILNSNWEFLEVNKGAEIMYGYSREEMIGKTPLDVAAPNKNNISHIIECLEFVLKNGGTKKFEFWAFRKNKALFLKEVIVTRGSHKNEAVVIATARDVTDRKNAELELLKFKSISDNAVHGNAIVEMDGTILYCNNYFASIHGYTSKELLGKNLSVFHSDNQLLHVLELNKILFENGSYETEEVWHTHKNGTEFPMLMNGIVIFNAKHEPLYLAATAIDITETKLAQKRLKESEAKFKGVFKYSNVGITIADKHANLKDVNNEFCKISGYSKDELKKQNFAELTWSADVQSEMILLDEINKGLRNNYRIEKRIITKKAEPKWIDITITAIRNQSGQVMEYIANVMDINAQKEAEHELRESEEKFRSIFNESPVGIEIFDGTGKLININKASLNMFGISDKSAVERFNLFDGTSFNAQIIELLRNGTPVEYTADFDFKRIRELKQYHTEKTGIATFDYRITPLFGRDQTTIDGYLMQVIDITQRKKSEIELIKAKEQAEESDRLKSAFLANMSHEIRTPMNGILGFAELLEQPSLSNEEKKEYVDIIKESGARMLSTVNDIIDISKIDAQQVVLDKTPVNVKREIDSLYLFFKPEALKKGLDLKLRSEFNSSDLVLDTDKGKFNSILTNLIKNAIKYTDHGEIEVGVNIQENNFKCWVKDTGIGIPENRKQAVFNRFEQADIADFYAREGSGLGLAIAKSYAEMLDGELYFESEQGVGSTFFFSLPWNPINENKSKQADENASEIKRENKQLNILIAEDDDISFEHLSIVLRKVTGKISRARNGIEVVEMANKMTDIDCILLDVKMPIMDGYEACRKIREFNPEVIIIAQTAYALENEREKALKAGCNDYIPKPINRELLLEMLGNLIT